jgi:hypothetical protein
MTKPKSRPKAGIRPAPRKTGKSKKPARSNAGSRKSTSRLDTKHASIIAMLRAPAGATIAAMINATEWQPHSVRGFLAGVVRKKLGLNLVSEQTDEGRIYRIRERKAPSAAAEPAKKAA